MSANQPASNPANSASIYEDGYFPANGNEPVKLVFTPVEPFRAEAPAAAAQKSAQEQHDADRARFEARSADAEEASPLTGIEELHRTIKADFPDLWPFVDVALSVCGVLFLEDAADCPSAIFVGPSGCGKSTVVEMFYGYGQGYRSDSFTPACFVTEAANLTEAQRREIDLLPRIQHKVLLTSECGTLFRGKAEAQAELFKIITRVLDGVGYARDAGTAGARGYRGDYLFGWLGGTTEVSDDTWHTMSNLGSRLFFCRFPSVDTVTTRELVNSAKRAESYKVRVERCGACVSAFMNGMYARLGFRGKSSDLEAEDEHILEWIARLSLLVAALRGMNRRQDDDAESPYRAFNILVNVACGHALVHGRERLTLADVVPVAHLAIGSVPRSVSRLLHHLLTIGPFDKKEARSIVRPRDDDEWKGSESAAFYTKMMMRAGIVEWNGHKYIPTKAYSWENPLDFKEISDKRADFEHEEGVHLEEQ